MHEQQLSDGTDMLEERVTRTLERIPEVTIPAGFAARVAALVPKRREFVAKPAHYGLLVMRVSMALLVIALMAVAMLAGGRNVFGIALEWVLCAELVALALWMSGVRGLITPEA